MSYKKEMVVCPANANKFLDIMRRRHAILLQSRISKRPVEFKDKNNRAVNTEFVDKQLVVGTLKKDLNGIPYCKSHLQKRSS